MEGELKTRKTRISVASAIPDVLIFRFRIAYRPINAAVSTNSLVSREDGSSGYNRMHHDLQLIHRVQPSVAVYTDGNLAGGPRFEASFRDPSLSASWR